DGIRDLYVTGVQTCALPISPPGSDLLEPRVSGDIGRILAEACWRQGGRERETIDVALVAAERLDPVAPLDAARARMLAAFAYHRDRKSVVEGKSGSNVVTGG